jgi:hypothetical protein
MFLGNKCAKNQYDPLKWKLLYLLKSVTCMYYNKIRLAPVYWRINMPFNVINVGVPSVYEHTTLRLGHVTYISNYIYRT